MRSVLGTVLVVYAAVLATAVGISQLVHHSPNVGETGCARVVHQYLHAAASAVGVSIHHEHLIACRQDGYESVARVEFDATMVAFGTTVHEVLAIHLVKSPWGVADVHMVG